MPRCLLTVSLLCLALISCDEGPSDPSVGSESHFLRYCEEDVDCALGAGPTECLCNVCTNACDTDGACTDLLTAATCLEVSRFPSCDVDVPAVCGVSCTGDTFCPTGTRCYDGVCLGGAPQPSLEASCDDAAECRLCDFPVAPAHAGECYCPACGAAALEPAACDANRGAWVATCGDIDEHCVNGSPACPPSIRAGCRRNRCERLEDLDIGATVWSSLPGIELAPISVPASLSTAELAEGVTIPYRVSVAFPVRRVTTRGVDLEAGCTPDPRGPHVTAIITDGGQRYCRDCRPPGVAAACQAPVPITDAAIHLAPQTLGGTLFWDGRSGGDTWPESLRQPFGGGTFSVTLRIDGQVHPLDGPAVPFEAGARFDIVVTP